MDKINWDDWKECTLDEYHKLAIGQWAAFVVSGGENIYFKLKTKTVFEDDWNKVTICKEGLRVNGTFFYNSKQIILDAVDSRKGCGKMFGFRHRFVCSEEQGFCPQCKEQK